MNVHVEQEAILDLLRETRAVALAAVASLDLSVVAASNRRGSEILAELANREAATASALAAHLAGAVDPGAVADYAPPSPATPAPELLDLWQRQREQLQETIAGLAWVDYHRRLQVAGGALFIGEIVKRLIGHEQFQVRALLAAAGLAQPFDGSADQ